MSLWHFSRLGRPTSVVRLLSFTIVLLFECAASAQLAHVSGTVVDRSGRPVPRAHVRALNTGGAEIGDGFADESGRFAIPASSGSGCTVEVKLGGFEPATAPCGTDLRIALTIAPVQETVIVSATLTDTPTSQIGASATVFTPEDLDRRQTAFISDLLATTPGAMIVRSGGPGALTSLFVRGGESDYNKVLLDGVPLNEPGGSFYLNNLTTENLERVEILRGAYSSLFGSDAMASVIQLFTRRADGTSRRPQGSVQIDGGTYQTVHANAAVSGTTGRADYAFGIAHFNSDNRVPNSALENSTLSANVGISLGARTMLRFIGRAELEHVGTPGATAYGRPDLDAFFERTDGIGSVSVDHQLTDAFRQRVMYSLATSGQTSTNLTLDPPYIARFEGRTATRSSTDFQNDSHGDLKRHHASYQADWRLASGGPAGTQLLTLLADWDGERAVQENRLSATETVNARDNFGVSAQHQLMWRRMFLTLGGRIERNESFGTEAVPRASLVYVAHSGNEQLGDTRVKASAGTGIKEPTMLESFSVSRFFLGNPNLTPERSRSLEVGVDQRFARDRAKVELTWFDNRFEDIISLITDPSTFEAQYFNVGITAARGIELGAQAAVHPAIRATGSYTFLDSEIVESTAPTNVLFAKGQWAFRRPRHSGSVGVTASWKRATADVSGVFVGRFIDSDFGLFSPSFSDRPGHTTWDARLSVRLTNRVTGLLLVDNLTNEDYSEPIGYQPLLRVIRAGIRVGF
jgi:vitamin B12 transporter